MSLALRYNRYLDAFSPVEETPMPTLAVVTDSAEPTVLESVLDGVTDEQWSMFVRRMVVQDVGDVSESNAVGMFAIMPRRLVDLGLADKLRRGRNASGRTIYAAAFVRPLTERRFLRSPQTQYAAFSKSMRDYADRIASGAIKKDAGMSLSGALAMLHKAGPRGLETTKRFTDTEALYQLAKECF